MELVRIFVRQLMRLHRLLISFFLKNYYRAAFSPNLRIGRSVTLCSGVYIGVSDGGSLHIEPGVTIGRNTSLIVKTGVLRIGKSSFVGNGCMIVSNDSVTIGQDVLIAERVTIRDQNHGTEIGSIPFWQQRMKTKPILINDNVWIGAGACVTAGAEIAKDIVVASNSVVTKRLSAPAIYGGVPATFIKDL